MANQLFEMLKQEHQEAKQLMQQISGAKQNREEMFIDLSDALTLHMQMEEKFFYPKLQDQHGFKQLVKDATKEHEQTKELLQRLDRLDAQDRQWNEVFRELQQGVLHHVQEEEKQIFPKCS